MSLLRVRRVRRRVASVIVNPIAIVDVAQLCERWPVGRYETPEGYIITIVRPGIQFTIADWRVTVAIEWRATRLDGTYERPRPLAMVTRSYGVLSMGALHTRTRWHDWGNVPSGELLIFERGLRLARLIHRELEANR